VRSLLIPDTRGVTQFVVGTGGRNLHTETGPQMTISEVLRTDSFGVLELTPRARRLWSPLHR
jgi:hypothetical protein